MKTKFQRIYTKDGIELHGLLYSPDTVTDRVLVHVHGMGGNFYENKFLDFIADKLTSNGIAFCAFNNRGAEFIKETYQILPDKEPSIVRVGTSYEHFIDSVLDISASIDFVVQEGYKDIHLSGHSLGCPKVVYYAITTNDVRIKSLLLLSPSDMLGLVRNDTKRFEKEMTEAKSLVAEGKGNELLSNWLWGDYPISANTYLNLFSDDAQDAIFNFHNPDDTLQKLLGIIVPTFATMGRKDDALVVTIEETLSRLEKALSNSPKVKTEILGDANHGYRGHEAQLADAIYDWLK